MKKSVSDFVSKKICTSDSKAQTNQVFNSYRFLKPPKNCTLTHIPKNLFFWIRKPKKVMSILKKGIFSSNFC